MAVSECGHRKGTNGTRKLLGSLLLFCLVLVEASCTSHRFLHRAHLDACKGNRKGGVSTDGVTASFRFFDGGTFWVLPLTYLYLPRSARAYLSPQSVNTHYFRSGPNSSVDPICPQPRTTGEDHARGSYYYHYYYCYYCILYSVIVNNTLCLY